jgi:hypothetical protein
MLNEHKPFVVTLKGLDGGCMTTTDTQKPKCRHSLRSLDGGCMTTTDTQKPKCRHSLRSSKSLVMTTSIKDVLSHVSVSGAVKSKF